MEAQLIVILIHVIFSANLQSVKLKEQRYLWITEYATMPRKSAAEVLDCKAQKRMCRGNVNLL